MGGSGAALVQVAQPRHSPEPGSSTVDGSRDRLAGSTSRAPVRLARSAQGDVFVTLQEPQMGHREMHGRRVRVRGHCSGCARVVGSSCPGSPNTWRCFGHLPANGKAAAIPASPGVLWQGPGWSRAGGVRLAACHEMALLQCTPGCEGCPLSAVTSWGHADMYIGIFTLLPTKNVNSDGSGLCRPTSGNVSEYLLYGQDVCVNAGFWGRG